MSFKEKILNKIRQLNVHIKSIIEDLANPNSHGLKLNSEEDLRHDLKILLEEVEVLKILLDEV